MSVRHLVRIGFAAVLAVSALGIGASMAHATGPVASVNVDLKCDPISGSQFTSANWHVHMALDAGAPSGELFGVFADFGAGGPQYLSPGQSADMVVDARDGLGSHLVVNADGIIIFDKIDTIVCNPPITSAVFDCGKDKFDRTITYSVNNPSPSTYNFVVHESNGYDAMVQLTAKSQILVEHVNDGAHYHGWISQNANLLTDIEGDANCESDPPTTAPPTTTPSTTTPPTTTPPTTAPPVTDPPVTDPPVTDPPTTAPPGTTPPTTVLSHSRQPGSTTTSTVAAAPQGSDPAPRSPAAPTGQLPFTGGSSVPLGALGFAFVGLGGLVVLALRRSDARS